VLKAEDDLSRYESQNGIADITAQTTGAITSATLLDTKLNTALVDRDQASAQIANLSAQLSSTPRTTSNGGSVQPNPVAADLRQQIARTNVDLRDARRQYTEEHPTVVGLVAQLASLERELARTPATIVSERDTAANPVYQQLSQQLANAQAEVASDDAQVALLRQQRAALTPTLQSLPGHASRLADLQRELKLANDVESALQQKYNDATVARTTAIADASVVQPADAASAVRTPNVPLVLAIGLVLGIALGIVVIVVREFFDATLKDAADIERDLALPVIGKIPLMPGVGDELALHDRYDIIEAFLQLVTALRYSSDKPLRTLAVTSPSVGDGKSTVALNTAKALGELAAINLDRLPAHVTNATEPRVLLVDADVRRPSVHKRLDLANTCGLSDVLVGNASIDMAIQRTPFPGLDVLTSGTASPNPIKLLTSERFDALLVELRSRYATVIFDAPAVTSVLDAAVVALKVDGTVMVLSAGTTDTRAARVAMARLESVGVTNLLGSILNRAHDMPEPYDDFVAAAAAVRGKPVKALRA
jgi:capsular exopolysaccharide synthesis family protein